MNWESYQADRSKGSLVKEIDCQQLVSRFLRSTFLSHATSPSDDDFHRLSSEGAEGGGEEALWDIGEPGMGLRIDEREMAAGGLRVE